MGHYSTALLLNSNGFWSILFIAAVLAIIYLVVHNRKTGKLLKELLANQQFSLSDHSPNFNDLLEITTDPVFVLNTKKEVIYWNEAIEVLTGVKREEILGKGDYAYATSFYGIPRPMLADFVDGGNDLPENYYTNVKRIGGKVYGEFSGLFRGRKNVYFSGVASPLYNHEGERWGTIEIIKDITAVKRAVEESEACEKKARIVFDTNEDIIILISPMGIILDCNLQFARDVGKPREKLVNENVLSFFPKKFKQNRMELLAKTLQSGRVCIGEDNCPNGTEYYITTLYPNKNKKNEIESLVIYIQDTTKLKKAEKALKHSEEQYRTITEYITDYVYSVVFEDGNVKLKSFNPGSEHILGYTPFELNTNPQLLYSVILPEEEPMVRAFLKNMLPLKKNTTIEHRIVHKSGKIIWVSNTLIFFKAESKNSIEYSGVIKDITLRKHFELALQEAEERYRSVFNQSGLASSVYDLAGKLIMQNSLAASLLGGTSYDFIGKSLEEILPPETARQTRLMISETLQKGSLVDEREVLLSTGKYWLKTTSHTIRNSLREIIGIQLISQDITEKKEMDRKILNTIIETEEKERMNFALELHDGLGPLISAIKMYVQWLSRPDAKISQNEILADTERLTNDASQAIREISFKLSPHVLNDFGLLEALKTFAAKVQVSKKIEIEIKSNYAERIDATKETIIYRILCECINNTVKHANATKINITFSKLLHKIRITYTDNGIGFDVETELNKKTGNGLFNIQSRMQSVNGFLAINSEPGSGTKIMIAIRL